MAEETVTQQGAGEQKPTRQREMRVSRTDMMNHIGRARVDEINNELVGSVEDPAKAERLDFVPLTDPNDDDHDDDDEIEIATKAEVKPETKPAKAEEEGTIYDFLDEERIGKTKTRIKVDGQEQEVLLADVLRDHQKSKAADKRLEDASLVKKRADEEAAEIVRKAQADADQIRKDAGTAGKNKTLVDDDAGNKESSLSVKDAISSAVTMIYEGDQEKAAEALGEAVDVAVRQRVEGSGTTANPKQLKAELKSELAWDGALAKFTADHQDIVQDPKLLAIWQGELNAAGPQSASPQEAIETATKNFTEWFAEKASALGGKQVTADKDALQKRQQDKDAAGKHAVRSSTSQKAALRPDLNQAPVTPTDVVAEMKRGRGQLR